MRQPGTLDPLDIEIIRLLQKDGRLPYSAIAERFDIAEGTVRKRVTRLMSEGYFRIVGVASPFKVGMAVVAIIGLNVARQSMTQARAHLQRLEPIRYIGITTGTFDYIIEVVLPSMQDLLRFLMSDLAHVPGLTHTETSLVLDIPKQSYDWLPSVLARPGVFSDGAQPRSIRDRAQPARRKGGR